MHEPSVAAAAACGGSVRMVFADFRRERGLHSAGIRDDRRKRSTGVWSVQHPRPRSGHHHVQGQGVCWTGEYEDGEEEQPARVRGVLELGLARTCSCEWRPPALRRGEVAQSELCRSPRPQAHTRWLLVLICGTYRLTRAAATRREKKTKNRVVLGFCFSYQRIKRMVCIHTFSIQTYA